MTNKGAFWSLLFGLATTGFAFIVLEILFIRELQITLGGTVYSSSATLASVMLGLFLGSQLFGYASSRVRSAVGLFVAMQAILVFCSLLLLPGLRMIGTLPGWEVRFLLSFLVILIPSIVVGGEIPVAMQIAEQYMKKGKTGLYAGFIYGADTLGALFGALVVAFLLLPVLGAYRSSLVAGAANLLSGLVMTFWMFGRSRTFLLLFWAFALTALGFSASAWGHNLDDYTLKQLLLHNYPFLPVSGEVRHLVQESPYQRIQLLQFIYSGSGFPGRSGTISGTIVNNESRIFFLDGVYMSSVPPNVKWSSAVYFPLLAHPNPSRILVIGCGDGDLISSALADPRIQRIDQVEIDPAVIAFARRYIPEQNTFEGQSIWENPKVHLHFGDGRQFVRESRDSYDIIIADLPLISHEMAGPFYTVEFMEQVRKHLRPGGLFMEHTLHGNWAGPGEHCQAFAGVGADRRPNRSGCLWRACLFSLPPPVG